jgi:hypothetical protein
LSSPHAGMLDMRIANPAAIAYLDQRSCLELLLRLARGRRSDAEIAAIEADLVKARTYYGEQWDRVDGGKADRHERANVEAWSTAAGVSDRTGYVAHQTGRERRKLAIARGEVLD